MTALGLLGGNQMTNTIDPDAQCPTHGCSRWRCDADHPPQAAVVIAAELREVVASETLAAYVGDIDARDAGSDARWTPGGRQRSIRSAIYRAWETRFIAARKAIDALRAECPHPERSIFAPSCCVRCAAFIGVERGSRCGNQLRISTEAA